MIDHAAKFKAKNEARKLARRIAGSALFRQGRQARADWAFQGAFGTLNAHTYNACVVGTAGFPRETKKTKDEYDEGSDYDG